MKRSSIERSIGYPGATVPPRLRWDAKDNTEKLLDRVRRNRPNGPSVKDKLGYRISYAQVNRIVGYRQYNSKRHLAHLEKEMEEEKRMREILGLPEDAIDTEAKIARDLDIPFHTVGLPEFEEWHRRGFRLEPGELQEPVFEEEADRLMAISAGSFFREDSRD
ncbi:hypothetical protein NKR23_g355 [Pleurostoma richardsiae]|uniref:Uncharacterized protein n=1 Tax=Pleurostoma richardsiae TaxID=41990 RepID=A0AA38RUN6_9PEZI|nr:hypothetical protein NKR23_g355 [Pleurostoma richardsiae]